MCFPKREGSRDPALLLFGWGFVFGGAISEKPVAAGIHNSEILLGTPSAVPLISAN
jgi:hypothetical protein